MPRTVCSQCAYGRNTRTYGYSSTGKFITHSPSATLTSSRSNPNATLRLLFTCTYASVRKRRPPCWTACSPSQSWTLNWDNSTWDGMYSEYDRCLLISRKVCIFVHRSLQVISLISGSFVLNCFPPNI